MPRAPQNKLTIRDIARLAEVSRSTVSLAINDSTRINAQTKAKVRRIMEEVGFRPNALARGLASDRAGTIAVVVPTAGQVFSDAYFSESLSGIVDAAAAEDWRVTIEMATPEFLAGSRPESLFHERRIDGIVAVGALLGDGCLERLFDGGFRVLLVNSEAGGTPCVVADNLEGTVAITHHLVALGHRRIGYIKGPDVTCVGRQRDEGFRQGLRMAGIPLLPDLIAEGDFSEESGHAAMGQIMRASGAPPAVFAANDMMAIGAMRRLKEAGLAVGKDVALVGGDDAPMARHVEPPLTTLRQSMYDMGAEATRLLLRWTRRGEPPPRRTVHHTELIVRESCGARWRRDLLLAGGSARPER